MPAFRQFLDLLHRGRTLALVLGVLLYDAGCGVFLTVLPASLAASHGLEATANSLLFSQFYAAIIQPASAAKGGVVPHLLQKCCTVH